MAFRQQAVAKVRADEPGGSGNDYAQISSKPYSKRGAYERAFALRMIHSKVDRMTDASWTERALVLVLMAASIALFWRRFQKVFIIIRRSRPTSDFEVAPLGPRIRQFLWEVAAQGKVIGQRPLPGLAHAFVFWGFCAFGLITLNHLATAFGLGFLSRDSGFGSFYFGFVAVWAVAVAVSIAGLFVRRFLVRPKWLGPVSPESGFIAFLIFIADGHLPGRDAGLAKTRSAGRVNWWLHTLSLLIFLPLIPHTKHLHLVLSPVTVFLGGRASAASRRLPATKISAWIPART